MRVLYDIRVLKGRLYKVMVRPAILYEMEVMTMIKRQESKIKVVEIKML